MAAEVPGDEDDPYVNNVVKAIATTTVAHLALGAGLQRMMKPRDHQGWPMWTYAHSLCHQGALMPGFLMYFALNNKGGILDQNWLEMAWPRSDLGAEQWCQASNIGFQVASTLLSLKKMGESPALIVHHLVTILGCASLLHRGHCVGYGAAFTSFTETGSTMHNVMSLWNSTATRWLRVISDMITRGGGIALILLAAPVERARLPLLLQVWSYLGGALWFVVNATWTQHVLKGLLRGRKIKGA